MLDHYQIQLTRMLEAEQFSEARDLLQFLLHVQGEDEHHYEEWKNLLSWIEMAFPESGQALDMGKEEDESTIRDRVLNGGEQDESYIQQVLYIMRNHPMIEQQLLALERAVHLNHPSIDPDIREWLSSAQLHPVVQFKALQCLKRRGTDGTLTLHRFGERVELDIDMTPLALDDFPPAVIRILERVEQITEMSDSTLPHFAREMWKECLQFLYGTSAYGRMLDEGEETVDCWAAALHLNLNLAAYGSANDDEIRDTYGISEAMRFRYEQACKSLRQIVEIEQNPDSHN
jgi:hypothetical protein